MMENIFPIHQERQQEDTCRDVRSQYGNEHVSKGTKKLPPDDICPIRILSHCSIESVRFGRLYAKYYAYEQDVASSSGDDDSDRSLIVKSILCVAIKEDDKELMISETFSRGRLCRVVSICVCRY